ncbi:CHAT domain-containing protein [Isoptericola hypogeus]|uniref:CHAT domain-containing protein n=1 Tax=Isoptericola hypogeus TaxID=300179 RepID=A0ABN2J0B9_9MICO
MGHTYADLLAEVDATRSHTRTHRQFGRGLRRYRAVLAWLDDVDGSVPDGQVAALRARVLVGIAACEGELGSDLDVVLAKLTAAAAMALRAGSEELVGLVHANLGLQLLRAGDLDGARHELDAALERMRDDAEVVPVLLNRGSLRLEAGDVPGAADDLRRCVELARDVGEESFVRMAEHNLGYALFLGGDLPAALRAMDSAASSAPPEHAGVGLMDKAAVLYEAGLLTDAEEALRGASEVLSATRGSRDLLDSWLTRSRCLVGLGRHTEALALARRARARARRAGHVLLDLRAGFIVLDARHGILEERRAGAASWLALARDGGTLRARAAETPGAQRVAVDALLLTAEALARGGRYAEALEDLGALPPPVDLALGTRVRVEVVRALCEFGAGDRRAGVAAVRRGHRLLASQRQRLGAVEAVTAAAAHGMRLLQVDVGAALASGRADPVFDAVERGRATFAGTGRVRPPDDPETARLVAEARQHVERARQLGAGPDAARQQAALRREAWRLQHRARERSWYAEGEAAVPEPTTARALRRDLREAGSDRVVLDLSLVRGRVLGVRVDARGARLVDLAPVDEVLEHARRVRADQEVLANALLPGPLRQAVLSSLERGLGWLDETLLGAAEVDGPVFVAARDRLVSLPWAALPSRRGHSTVVNSWVARGVAGWRPGPGLAVAGPGLGHAAREVAAVAATWGSGTTLLTGEDATCAAVVAAVDGAPVVHVAAHGVHEPENPVFSSLHLADGPLFAHELDGKDLTRSVVVLSACDVGSVSTRHGGGEPLGLTSVLLRMGARAVIASVAPLRDDVAVRIMAEVHVGLREGLRPGAALAAALADEPEPVPLVCFGPLVL